VSTAGRCGLQNKWFWKSQGQSISDGAFDQAFAVAAPRLWNKLPPDIRTIADETKLQTHLFRMAFNTQ